MFTLGGMVPRQYTRSRARGGAVCVEGRLHIARNDALTSLQGLQGITRVEVGLAIQINADPFTTFDNLESLQAHLRTNAP